MIDSHRLVAVTIDPVATQRRAAAGLDLHARQSVSEDVVVFQGSPAAVINIDANALLTVVYLVATQRGLPPALMDTPEGVAEDVVVLQRSLAFVMYGDPCLPSVVDPVATQRRVAGGLDLHACQSVAEDVVVFQRSRPLL